MEDEPSSTKNRILWGLTYVLGVVSMIFVLYALSAGPVIRFYGRKPPPPALESFYQPLGYLYDHVTIARQFYDWYFKLWGIKK